MSYARFSYADVYVYMDVNGSLSCCGCRLGPERFFDSTQAMIEHLAEHRAAGHDVPDGIEDDLRADDAENFPPPGSCATRQQGRDVSGVRVVGLDLSLTGTGVAGSVGWVATYSTKLRGHERLYWLRQQVRHSHTTAHLVVVEGPAYGSAAGARQSGHHERAGLWWLITHDLWSRRVPYVVVPPNIRAKYATGKGNASKDAVLAAVVRRYPDVEVSNNNEADALVLAAMGARHLGHPIDDLPQTHLAAMGAVQWPEVAA